MADIEAKLDYLEDNMRTTSRGFGLLLFLLKAEERGQMLSHSLELSEGMVRDFNDGCLTNLYNDLFKSSRNPAPYQQIHPDDYFAFLNRLQVLIDEAAAKANAADIDLRESIGLQSVIGIWGGKGWRPPSL